jgi:cyclic pyranopterin monophosphate synthase
MVIKPACYNSGMSNQISHLDHSGKPHMVDVGSKPETERIAIARGEVHMKPETLTIIQKGNAKKGDVLSVAQIAGIMAAKRTSELIPLCHPILLDQIVVDISVDPSLPGILIEATVKSRGQTGVEIEALTAVSIAALTIYDMAKAIQKSMRIQNIRLVEKHGGVSGDVSNEEP